MSSPLSMTNVLIPSIDPASIHPPILYPSIHLSCSHSSCIHPSCVHPSCIRPSIYPLSIHPSIHPVFIHPSCIHLSIQLSYIHLSDVPMPTLYKLLKSSSEIMPCLNDRPIFFSAAVLPERWCSLQIHARLFSWTVNRPRTATDHTHRC